MMQAKENYKRFLSEMGLLGIVFGGISVLVLQNTPFASHSEQVLKETLEDIGYENIQKLGAADIEDCGGRPSYVLKTLFQAEVNGVVRQGSLCTPFLIGKTEIVLVP